MHDIFPFDGSTLNKAAAAALHSGVMASNRNVYSEVLRFVYDMLDFKKKTGKHNAEGTDDDSFCLGNGNPFFPTTKNHSFKDITKFVDL